jgi:hypothetical protein
LIPVAGQNLQDYLFEVVFIFTQMPIFQPPIEIMPIKKIQVAIEFGLIKNGFFYPSELWILALQLFVCFLVIRRGTTEQDMDVQIIRNIMLHNTL